MVEPRGERGRYELIEHTADMGIEASAPTLASLFTAAARGLLEILTGRQEGAGQNNNEEERETIELTAEEEGELLVAWLSEILYLVQTVGFLPAAFEIERLEAGRLSARVGGRRIGPSGGILEREVKAVTYHQLRVEETGGIWMARVFVDL